LQLAHYGYFGPPVDIQQDGSQGKDKMEIVEKFWKKLEEQTEKILAKHSAEVHAVAQALLERNDLTGKQCIEVIKASATNTETFDSELLLKALVEETIVSSNGNGKSEEAAKAKGKRKLKPKERVKLTEE